MMKKNLLTQLFALAFCLVGTSGLFAQSLVTYETAASSTQFGYFANGSVGGVTDIIDNPDQTGINTTNKIGAFTKGAGAANFAGAFATSPITVDFSVYSEICVKVWSPAVSNLRLKLEQPTTGVDNWEQELPITQTNVWTELCFDSSLPDLANPDVLPAAGRVFNQLVLFFDFGTFPGTETTYFFDDIRTQGTAYVGGDITFSVNLNNYAGGCPTTAPFVGGNFPPPFTTYPLSDADGDGVWETTLNIPPGEIRYQYFLDGFCASEFNAGDVTPCTSIDFGFTNRIHIVNGDATLPTYFFGTCDVFNAPNDVPTMGEWALFILALLMVAVGGVFILGLENKQVLATTSGSSAISGTIKSLPFDKGNFFRAMKHAVGLAIVGFAAIYFVWCEIVFADLVGMLISMPIVAYIIHLLYKK